MIVFGYILIGICVLAIIYCSLPRHWQGNEPRELSSYDIARLMARKEHKHEK